MPARKPVRRRELLSLQIDPDSPLSPDNSKGDRRSFKVRLYSYRISTPSSQALPPSSKPRLQQLKHRARNTSAKGKGKAVAKSAHEDSPHTEVASEESVSS
ncbi:hypothetical protein J1614_012261 [Plenodomus biglobosus]|nr:hypothetical protein J1614_012261 [Plenodomus biglobosus]